MGFHTFDPSMADRLEDVSRFRFCSREELLQHLPRGRILDVGSGTGFYTDELAPFVDSIVALDVQHAMQKRYEERGVPDTVSQVTADAESLPFPAATFDGAVSTMTFHESTTEPSIAELRRTLDTDGVLVVVDWSSNGDGESGPPVDERFSADDAHEILETGGFTVEASRERTETLFVRARA